MIIDGHISYYDPRDQVGEYAIYLKLNFIANTGDSRRIIHTLHMST